MYGYSVDWRNRVEFIRTAKQACVPKRPDVLLTPTNNTRCTFLAFAVIITEEFGVC